MLQLHMFVVMLHLHMFVAMLQLHMFVVMLQLHMFVFHVVFVINFYNQGKTLCSPCILLF